MDTPKGRALRTDPTQWRPPAGAAVSVFDAATKVTSIVPPVVEGAPAPAPAKPAKPASDKARLKLEDLPVLKGPPPVRTHGEPKNSEFEPIYEDLRVDRGRELPATKAKTFAYWVRRHCVGKAGIVLRATREGFIGVWLSTEIVQPMKKEPKK